MTWAVTSAVGGSVTSPKSQKGRAATRLLSLSASKAPHPPSRLCMPSGPGRAPPAGGVHVRAGCGAGPAQGEDYFGGVVDVGVVVVGELERPSAGCQAGPAYGPVAGDRDLLAEQPAGRGGDGRMFGVDAGVAKGDHGQGGVPHRRLARFDAPPLVVVNEEVLESMQGGGQDRVVERVALKVQGDDGVDDRGLDASPEAVGFLAADDPLLRPTERSPAEEGRGRNQRGSRS